jgi:N-acetylmuramic acid 6-phosphate etherase
MGRRMTDLAKTPRPRTEAVDEATEFLDSLAAPELFSALLNGQAKAVTAIEKAQTQLLAAIDAAHSVLVRPRSRLIYCGAGTSGRIALLDAVELKPTFNWPSNRIKVLLAGGEASFLTAQEGAEDDLDAARHDMHAVSPGRGDVVVGLAASGTTPYVLKAINEARKSGALTVGFSNNPATPLLEDVAYPILLDTGPEALAGSTRLAAGTSQKIALNIFSTMLMVRLGKVYRGRMVDMRVTNKKLRLRAIAMIIDIVGCSESQARAAFETAGYRVKEAILVANGASPTAAELALQQAGGVLAIAAEKLHLPPPVPPASSPLVLP